MSGRRMSSIDLKIVVLGPAYVGKTSIIVQLCNGTFMEDTISTIGAGFWTYKMNVDGNEITSMIWDTAGEERFRSVAPSLLRGADGLILVYDLTQANTFVDMNVYLEMFIDTCKFDLSNPLPVLLLGNKCDLPAVVSSTSIEEWKLRNRIVFSANISAKTGDGVNQAIQSFIKTLVSPNIENDAQPIKIRINQTPIKNNSCCG